MCMVFWESIQTCAILVVGHPLSKEYVCTAVPAELRVRMGLLLLAALTSAGTSGPQRTVSIRHLVSKPKINFIYAVFKLTLSQNNEAKILHLSDVYPKSQRECDDVEQESHIH